MNPNFKLGFFTARTLRAAAKAISPSEPKIPQLDQYVIEQIEQQLKVFSFWHRFGFLLGLTFLEWGGPIGAWGVLPFSLLSREKATQRLEAMMHSRLSGVRLFAHGLKVLVCLSVYGHAEVEAHFGFNRRHWRKNRLAFRDALVSYSDQRPTPPTPTSLAESQWISTEEYLAWDALDQLKSSPFEPSHYIDGSESTSTDKIEDEKGRGDEI